MPTNRKWGNGPPSMPSASGKRTPHHCSGVVFSAHSWTSFPTLPSRRLGHGTYSYQWNVKGREVSQPWSWELLRVWCVPSTFSLLIHYKKWEDSRNKAKGRQWGQRIFGSRKDIRKQLSPPTSLPLLYTPSTLDLRAVKRLLSCWTIKVWGDSFNSHLSSLANRLIRTSLTSGLRPTLVMFICIADPPSWLCWALFNLNIWFVFSQLDHWVWDKNFTMENLQYGKATSIYWQADPTSVSINRRTPSHFQVPSGGSYKDRTHTWSPPFFHMS